MGARERWILSPTEHRGKRIKKAQKGMGCGPSACFLDSQILLCSEFDLVPRRSTRSGVASSGINSGNGSKGITKRICHVPSHPFSPPFPIPT